MFTLTLRVRRLITISSGIFITLFILTGRPVMTLAASSLVDSPPLTTDAVYLPTTDSSTPATDFPAIPAFDPPALSIIEPPIIPDITLPPIPTIEPPIIPSIEPPLIPLINPPNTDLPTTPTTDSLPTPLSLIPPSDTTPANTPSPPMIILDAPTNPTPLTTDTPPPTPFVLPPSTPTPTSTTPVPATSSNPSPPAFNPPRVLADTTPVPSRPDPTPQTPAETPSETPKISNPTPTPTPPPVSLPVQVPLQQSAFVSSVRTRRQQSFNPATLAKAALWALLMVLLIVFPAELFNSTLAANYDEVIAWFKFRRLQPILKQLRRLPKLFGAIVLAVIGATLNSQLSPGFGFNRASLALVAGMFMTLAFIVLVYDIARSVYMRRRFGITSVLRTHGVGLVIAVIFVVASRLAHFLPGYFYGLFTALIFSHNVTDEEDGEGLMVATVGLLLVAGLGWWLRTPLNVNGGGQASFLALAFDAMLASLWVAALGAIVFGLAPIRFFYGEQVKKWSKLGWTIIYFVGAWLFMLTLLNPNQSIYGKSGQTSWAAVLALFVGFGICSLAFWGYFRYRHFWRHAPEEQEHIY